MGPEEGTRRAAPQEADAPAAAGERLCRLHNLVGLRAAGSGPARPPAKELRHTQEAEEQAHGKRHEAALWIDEDRGLAQVDRAAADAKVGLSGGKDVFDP